LKRALPGLVAGVIAGVGLRLTWRPLLPVECATADSSECALTIIWTLPMFLVVWTVAAGLVLHWALRRRPEVVDVVKVSGALWALLALAAWNTGVLAQVEVVLPVVAFPVATLFPGPLRETRQT
jgi:RsiW-degrading membrane proteinase PrsW (M82 family)